MKPATQTLLEGWPVAATLAIAVAGERVRTGRRRNALNGAVHELRRPLQILALAGAAPPVAGAPRGRDGATPLELTWFALADLERRINGEAGESFNPRLVRCGELVEEAAERWRAATELGGGSIALRARCAGVLLMADPVRVGQCLDNLIANALEHGGPRVEIETGVTAARVRVSVSGSAPPGSPADRVEVGALMARLGGRRRRGHGLRAVSAVAALHGGRLLLVRNGEGTAAVLELPLAGADPAQAA